MPKTRTRPELEPLIVAAAGVLLSMAVIPMLALVFTKLVGVPAIIVAGVGLTYAHRAHRLGAAALGFAATAVLLLASWLIADHESLEVQDSGYLQCAVVLTAAAVLAGLAGAAILLSGQWIGVCGLIAAGALRIGADCMTAVVAAQADPAGDNEWSGLGDALSAMMYGAIGGLLAGIAALVVLRRVSNHHDAARQPA